MWALVAIYAGLGVVSVARGFRRSSWLWTWLGLSTVALAIATAPRSAAGPSADLWSSGALMLESSSGCSSR